MKQIIKTKFLCKNGSRTAPRVPIGSIKWKDRFIESRCYDGEELRDEKINVIIGNVDEK